MYRSSEGLESSVCRCVVIWRSSERKGIQTHLPPHMPWLPSQSSPPYPYYPISQPYLLPLVIITPFSVEKESLGRPCIFQSHTTPPHTPTCPPPPHNPQSSPTPPIPPHHISTLPAASGNNHSILCREGITGQILHIPITHTPPHTTIFPHPTHTTLYLNPTCCLW